MAFQAYRRPLEMLTAFKYLERVLTASYDDWPSVVDNIRKAWSRWAHFSIIFGWEGADPWTSGIFYKAVFQANLLFGSENWVVIPRIGRTLGGFHHRMDHCLSVMQPKKNMAGR